MSGAPNRAVDVVALGGGHGLAASLQALRRVTPHLTAVVGVSDDGGSSGRLREEFGIVPPGDLRMALAALCGDDTWGSTWARVLQHRFSSKGDLDGHSLGNLLITALWEETNDVVEGLDWVARLLDAKGKVLPLCIEPLEIYADVLTATGQTDQVRGQVQVARTQHKIQAIGLEPKDPIVCEQAIAAVRNADFVVLGPGSWYTSVLTHFQVPQMAQALHETTAARILVVNLRPQTGETEGYSAASYIEVLAKSFPEFKVDFVLVDENQVGQDPARDDGSLQELVAASGARLILAPLAKADGPSDQHDPSLLASAFSSIFAHGRINPWQ
jgi:uncharacterized cofD-like protein